ncbi:hypothetical protein D3C71_1673220 [compost metagenome]
MFQRIGTEQDIEAVDRRGCAGSQPVFADELLTREALRGVGDGDRGEVHAGERRPGHALGDFIGAIAKRAAPVAPAQLLPIAGLDQPCRHHLQGHSAEEARLFAPTKVFPVVAEAFVPVALGIDDSLRHARTP